MELWTHFSPDYGLFKVQGGEQLGQKLVHHLVSQGGGAGQVGQQQVGDWLSEAQACDQHLEEVPNSLTGLIFFLLSFYFFNLMN